MSESEFDPYPIPSNPPLIIDTDTDKCRVCTTTKCVGIHYGSITCRNCAKFFVSHILNYNSLKCKNNFNCNITFINKNKCSKCRYDKCVNIGMKKIIIKSFK